MKRLLGVLVAACVAGSAFLAIPALAATRTVSVKDNFFAQRTLTVGKRTTVKWVWRGKRPHNVAVKRGPEKFRSGAPVRRRAVYKHTFKRRGTYVIHCEIHPGMEMTVRVR
jgi:plastocyanin